MVDVCLIGTGGMLPLKDRWLTGLYIEVGGKAALIDCGEGAQIALVCAGCKLSKISMILITHVHADHIAGLPGLLLSIGNTSRVEPIDIFVPKGSMNVIKSIMCVCDILPYEVNIHEIASGEFATDLLADMTSFSAIELSHRVKCYGYSFTLNRKPVFDPNKADELGVPMNMRKLLHSGKNVVLDNGKVITPNDVISDIRKPIKITYVTDSLPIDDISKFASDSDLFICEGMYGDLSKKDSMNQKRHMLMQDACMLAKKANVKSLWLTHYSPAMTNPKEYEDTLKEIFENTVISSDGEKITL